MWRDRAASRQAATEHLDQALLRVLSDGRFVAVAEGIVQKAAAAEPLIAESLRTPQSLPHHAEGPFLEAHLCRALAVLAAIGAGDLHLGNIEEFRRLRGYEGEIDELEETLRERQAFFEAFILCHDAAKFSCASCEAEPGTRGEELGFRLPASAAWTDHGMAERALLRNRYLDLYKAFVSEHREAKPEDTQALFYETYGIRVHYAGHDRLIHAPVYQALLARVALMRELPETDAALLEDLIAHHLQPLQDFSEMRPERISRYVAVAESRGYDADDFLDLLQAAFFLDAVAGSCHREGGRVWQEASTLVHFFQSEHAYAPWKREAKEKMRADSRKQKRNQHFRAARLDGAALLELLAMKPGPAFGAKLAEIHAAIEGNGEMPAFPPAIAKELARRVETYKVSLFPL